MLTLLIYLSLDETIFGCPKMLNLAAAWDLPAALAVNRQHNQIKQSIGVSFFTALHVMQTRYSDENSVRLSHA